jgi:hypothetical protein
VACPDGSYVGRLLELDCELQECPIQVFPTRAPKENEDDVSCPDRQPSPQDTCIFEGICSYGEETCCGETYSSFIAECFEGQVTGLFTDACTNPDCKPDGPVCTMDTEECPDGSFIGRLPELDCNFEECPKDKSGPTILKASGSGDPHFKTWTGDKFDYHGACDLVLVDNPTFADGLGLRVHIRTTRINYFSFIEQVAIQLGDDVLEFDNDVEHFLINGAEVEENRKHHKTFLGDFLIRRDPKALSIRLNKDGKAKIDLHTRKNGFPAVIVDPGSSDIFEGSLGLLGEWGSGKKLARDGITEMNDEDATAFALEWQVRDDEPMIFKESRFPQFPMKCTPPTKMLSNRLGSMTMRVEAEEVCSHWEEDMEDCIFDVMATRDVGVAVEGNIVHIK